MTDGLSYKEQIDPPDHNQFYCELCERDIEWDDAEYEHDRHRWLCINCFKSVKEEEEE